MLGARQVHQDSKSIIVGLGNSIMCDDAIGPVVAQRIRERIGEREDLAVVEAAVGGFELVELVLGYDKAVVVDAIQTEGGIPGDHYLLDLEGSQFRGQVTLSHQVGLIEGLDMMRRLGTNVPHDFRVYAVEVVDPYTFSTELTPHVAACVDRVADAILAEEFPGLIEELDGVNRRGNR